MGTLLGNKHLAYLWLEFLVYTQRILSWFALEILLSLLREGKRKTPNPHYRVERFSWVAFSKSHLLAKV